MSRLVPEMGLGPITLSGADFKSAAYTNSATRAHHLEVPTGIEPVYAVLQTAA